MEVEEGVWVTRAGAVDRAALDEVARAASAAEVVAATERVRGRSTCGWRMRPQEGSDRENQELDGGGGDGVLLRLRCLFRRWCLWSWSW